LNNSSWNTAFFLLKINNYSHQIKTLEIKI
jgi:hypothetical protein